MIGCRLSKLLTNIEWLKVSMFDGRVLDVFPDSSSRLT